MNAIDTVLYSCLRVCSVPTPCIERWWFCRLRVRLLHPPSFTRPRRLPHPREVTEGRACRRKQGSTSTTNLVKDTGSAQPKPAPPDSAQRFWFHSRLVSSQTQQGATLLSSCTKSHGALRYDSPWSARLTAPRVLTSNKKQVTGLGNLRRVSLGHPWMPIVSSDNCSRP